MATLTEIVAAVVVHSSAAAYSHFGVTVDAPQADRPAPSERVVSRTAPAAKKSEKTPDRPSERAKTGRG